MLIGVLVVPAAVFALAYYPIVNLLARGLLSPYVKADVRRRLLAATIDGLLVVTTGYFYWSSTLIAYPAVGAAYLLLRDAFRGQSVGKFLLGLVVISLETGRPCSFAGSLRRNVLLVLPGANLVAVFLEARTIVQDSQGQRLGDRLAHTQVVDGLGAMELVKWVEEWLMGIGSEFGRTAGRRPRVPAPVDRQPAACGSGDVS
jgi:uncharacterized RDD family membrane protein YckC